MERHSYAAICAQVNGALEVRRLVGYIGWHPEKLTRDGDVFRGLCPIHRETVFRTLVLNPRNNTYHCEHVNCPGNHPSDFLDLLAKVTGKTLPEAIGDVLDDFGPRYFDLSPRQVAVIRRLVEEVRGQNGEGAVD